MIWFINFYKCPRCKERWCNEWSTTCDDDCPSCGTAHISPHESDEARPEPLDVLRHLAETFRRVSMAENLSAADKLAMLCEHADGVFAALAGADDA
jgi:hypothetical protein